MDKEFKDADRKNRDLHEKKEGKVVKIRLKETLVAPVKIIKKISRK